MIKYLGGIFLALAIAFPAQAGFSYRRDVKQMTRELEAGQFIRMAERTDQALDTMIRLAYSQLWRKGYPDEAERLMFEWDSYWHGFLVMAVEMEGLGDHAPLSLWLADWYLRLESILGPVTMKLLHLDDIEVVNYGIPVIFHLQSISEPIDLPEYGLHWNPFSGVVAYWSVYIACNVTTSGMVGFFLCSPAGSTAEFVVANYVAPKFAPGAYAYFYLRTILIPD